MRKGKRERNTIIEIVRGKRNTKKDKQIKKKQKKGHRTFKQVA